MQKPDSLDNRGSRVQMNFINEVMLVCISRKGEK